MFSQALNEFIEDRWRQRRRWLQPFAAAVESEPDEDERVLLRYFYATMPLRDAAACAPEVFADYARHAVMLRRNVEWCRALPEEVFLHHVAYYRVNTENIEPNRGFFFSLLYPLVLGLPADRAALEINYWCAAHVRYVSNDRRTASPLTLYRAGEGRCGEESAFAVTALRSVGLPARQVYAPWWAHCDDNHAWVELFTDGAWHFMGACEPEQTLDRGWFNAAAARAMVVCSRTFSSYPDRTSERLGSDGLLHFYNSTPLYAPVRTLTLRVYGPDGAPCAGAETALSIVNMAQPAPLVRMRTGADGAVRLSLGRGDVLASARAEGRFACAVVSAEQTEAALTLCEQSLEAAQRAAFGQSLRFRSPPPQPPRAAQPDEAQRALGQARLRDANEAREARIAAFFDAAAAARHPQARELLLAARGNFGELERFLSGPGETLRLRMLQTLARKDLLDARAALLESHLQAALALRERVRLKTGPDGEPVLGPAPDAVFDECVLCPRIDFEELTMWRTPIREAFSPEQRQSFLREPRALAAWCAQELRSAPEEEYAVLITPPDACLTLRTASELSRRVFFAAACRSLGIPARLDPHSREAQFWEDGRFVPAWPCGQDEASARLTLRADRPAEFVYNAVWTLARLENGGELTLDYEKERFDGHGELSLALRPGSYRLLVTARLPNGSQIVRAEFLTLAAGQTERRELSLPRGALAEGLLRAALPEVWLGCEDGTQRTLQALLAGQRALLLLLRPGEEPTEHALNELLARSRQGALPYRVLLVTDRGGNRESETMKAASAIPGCEEYTAAFSEQLEPLARAVFADPGLLPLLAAVGGGGECLYACSGYHVGSVDMAERLLELDPAEKEKGERNA